MHSFFLCLLVQIKMNEWSTYRHFNLEMDTSKALISGATKFVQMIELAPETVKSNGEIHHLAEFFTARLSDWCDLIPDMMPGILGISMHM